MFEDPVAKAEREIKELEELYRAEQGIQDGGSDAEGSNAEPANAEAKKEGEPEGSSAEGAGDDQQQREPEKTPEEDPNSETYKQRWLSLNGMMAGLQRENQGLSGEISKLKTQLQELVLKSQTTEDKKPEDVEDAIDDLTREYGEDFTKALDKRVQAIVNQVMGGVEKRVNQVERSVKVSAQERFFSRLAEVVPGWRAQNDDPAFIAWAKHTKEPFSGRPYSDIAVDAFNRGDVESVALVFQLFGSNNGQPGSNAGGPQSANPTKQPAPSADHLVVPGKTSTPTGNQSRADNSRGKVWRQSEIEDFYKRMELGKVPQQEAARIEAEIFQAAREDRIVG